MIDDILFVLWFFLPIGAANVMPIFSAHISFLKKYEAPMDGGRSFRGKRIFGAHKTWRGLISGVIAGTLTLALQQYLFKEFSSVRSFANVVDYAHLPTLIVGPLFAIGAIGGDALESFFKRQRGIAPGKGWFPFDQTDFIIGAIITTWPYVSLSSWHYFWLLVLGLGIHVLSTIAGYFMGLKESPI